MCDACNEQVAVETWGDGTARLCLHCTQPIAYGQGVHADVAYAHSMYGEYCSEDCKAFQASVRL